MRKRYVKALVIDAPTFSDMENGQVVTLDLGTFNEEEETVDVVGEIGGWFMNRFGIDPVAK